MPLVNRTFDQLIDFTRTSAATFVNSSGNIASTAQSRNLLTFTEEFANAAWTKTRSSIAANSTAAPNGINTADTLNEDSTASSTHPVSVAVTLAAAAHTLSIYVKASGRSWVQISLLSTANAFANFNVSTGALGTVGSAATATITSVGNGWYRCTMTATTGSGANTVAIYPASADNTVSFTGTSIASLFIWGAQLEQASAATDYTRNFGGLFPPRFDYDPVTRAPRGLLIEEQRTNLLVRSEEFDNAAWSKADLTVTANSTTSPDGTADADTIIPNTTNTAIHRLAVATSITAASHSLSVYAKASGYSWLKLRLGSLYANFNVSTGVAGVTGAGVTSTITNVGNGWYRCTMTGTTAGSDTLYISPMTTDNAAVDPVSYAGDGTSGVFLWGAQLEAGAFATSYIPTVASQVTRSADQAAINAPNFASWYNGTAGTLVAEWMYAGANSAAGAFGRTTANISDGTANNRLQIYNINGNVGAFVGTGGVTQATLDAGSTSPVDTVIKGALAYATNDIAFVRNGGTVQTDASATIPTVNSLTIGSEPASARVNGWVRSIRFYPTRLSNAQLQALTA